MTDEEPNIELGATALQPEREEVPSPEPEAEALPEANLTGEDARAAMGAAAQPTEPPSLPAGDPYAGWTPEQHDLVPLLPRGTALFEGLPARAVNIEALCPAIGHGAVIIRGQGSVGVVLVQHGAPFEEYAFELGVGLEGEDAVRAIGSWEGAVVAAYSFDPLVVAVVPALFRGSPCYADLRMEWTDWGGLLADLCSREGSFVVELDTPLGRGVTLIVDGRQVATYTENHLELGPETLLDPLAATRRGTIWVRRETGGAPVAPESAALPEAASPLTALPDLSAPAEPPAEGWEGSAAWPADAAAEPAGYGPLPPPPDSPPRMASGSPFAPFARTQPNELAWASASALAGPEPEMGAGATPVAVLAPELKQVARLHLQRSSPRVESMVDEAAARGLPLEDLLVEIRGLVIRGVMQSTLDQVADEMAALAGPD